MLDKISDDDAELLLKRVHENKKKIINVLLEEYIAVDTSMLYGNHVAACKKIIEDPEQSADKLPASNREEKLDLDVWESLFARLDIIERKLSEPKSCAKNLAKSSTKLSRHGSTNNLDRTEITGSNTTLNMNTTIQSHNQTAIPLAYNQSMMLSATNVSMMPPPSRPAPTMNTERLVLVSESMLADFNKMKVTTLEDLHSNRLDSEMQNILVNIKAMVNKLEVFFETLQNSAKNVNQNKSKENPLAGLNAEFYDILRALAEAAEYVRIMERNKDPFGVIDDLAMLELPLSEHLTEILQKYNHG